jgi:hypothetical protein
MVCVCCEWIMICRTILYAGMYSRMRTHVSAQRTCFYIRGTQPHSWTLVHVCESWCWCACKQSLNSMKTAAVHFALNSTIACHLFAIAGSTPAARIRLFPSMTHTSTSGMSSTVLLTSGSPRQREWTATGWTLSRPRPGRPTSTICIKYCVIHTLRCCRIRKNRMSISQL